MTDATLHALEVARRFQRMEDRIAKLESLLRCPRCHGSGSIDTRLGIDECPTCHGDKYGIFPTTGA